MISHELNSMMNAAGARTFRRANFARRAVDTHPHDQLASQPLADEQQERSPLIETFGNNLIRLRKERGLSRAALGRLSGLETNSLYNIEHCISNARLNTIEKLAQALKVHPDELLR